eukprot:5986070-Pyramimonas_sp.AAC.1
MGSASRCRVGCNVSSGKLHHEQSNVGYVIAAGPANESRAGRLRSRRDVNAARSIQYETQCVKRAGAIGA